MISLDPVMKLICAYQCTYVYEYGSKYTRYKVQGKAHFLKKALNNKIHHLSRSILENGGLQMSSGAFSLGKEAAP